MELLFEENGSEKAVRFSRDKCPRNVQPSCHFSAAFIPRSSLFSPDGLAPALPCVGKVNSDNLQLRAATGEGRRKALDNR